MVRLLAAALAAALLGPPAGADAAPGTLTLTGTHHGWAVLDLASEVLYDVERATAFYPRGAYAGFAIGRDYPTLWTRDHDLRRRRPLLRGHSATRGVLSPGRHRVYLFADEGHEVVVRIPWSGPDRTIALDAPLDAAVTTGSAVAVPGSGAPAVVLPQPSARGHRMTGIAMFESVVAPRLDTRICLTARPATCEKAYLGATLTGGGTALNGAGASVTLWPVRTATPLAVRGEFTGDGAGTLTVTALRWKP